MTKEKNKTWRHNHDLIEAAALNHLKKSNQSPTLKMYSEATGLSQSTIKKHIKSLSLPLLVDEFKPYLSLILMGLIKSFLSKGRKSEAELLFKIIANWKESSIVEHKFNSITDLFKDE